MMACKDDSFCGGKSLIWSFVLNFGLSSAKTVQKQKGGSRENGFQEPKKAKKK